MLNSSASAHGAGYFLYHSIGMYQDKAADLAREMAAFAESWGVPNDAQWPYILERRQHFIDLWRQIIGAPAGTVTTCESVTQGVHSIITALPENHLRGRRVLVAADCFPSVHFLLAGLAPRLGFTLDTVALRPGASWVEDEDMQAAWGPDVGVALLTWVTSTASARCDLGTLVAHGRRMGSIVGVDITQGAGLLPFDVMAPKVDFAVSTSLKWMCGTPGAGMLHVDQALAAQCSPELRGWFSQANPFSWSLDAFSYAPDARRFDSGTPASLPAIASLPALRWHARQDHAALAAHNRALCDRLIDGIEANGLNLHSPREVNRRGGSVMLRMADRAEAVATVAALKDADISADFRDAILRLSPGVLTESSAVDRAIAVIATAAGRS